MTTHETAIKLLGQLKADIADICAALPRLRPVRPDDDEAIRQAAAVMQKGTTENEPDLFEAPQTLNYLMTELRLDPPSSRLAVYATQMTELKQAFNSNADKKADLLQGEWGRGISTDEFRQQVKLMGSYRQLAQNCDKIIKRLFDV